MKFARYNVRQLIYSNRAKLKGTKIFIYEDLTSHRQSLVNVANRSPQVLKVYTADGRVKALKKSTNKWMATVEVGQRVVRSATWTSGDEDGGEGHLGTVVKLKDQDPHDPIPPGWAKIRWDNGNVNNYQVGSCGSYDLALFDSAPAGVIHNGAVCDSCLMDPIAGLRWKCSDQSCPDYDLCTPCYMNDRHDLTHSFIRSTSRNETGTQVTPRLGEAKTVSRGLCPEAEVCRGKDWQGDDEDGAGGTVVEICPFSERPRSGVTVCWTQSKLVTTHRVGFDGKMDLKCTTAGKGIGYYATHLPVLDARPDGSGHTEIVKPLPPLLETEDDSLSDSDSDEGGEESQLIKAAKIGNVERVVEILSTSPEKAHATFDGKTALHMAAAHGHLEVVQALLESGTEIDITTKSGSTPLHYSVEGDEPAITKYLIGKGADINRGNDDGRRAIHRAAYKGFVDCARVLINHGCDVNVQDTEKDTPLHDAIMKDKVDVIELLVKVPDLDVTLANKRGFTALQCAAVLDKPEPAELIAQSCPRSIVAARGDGLTILHIGAACNHVEVMKVVMAVKDHGLDVNAKDVQGRTALHMAAFRRQSHIIEFLVSHGADINLQGHDDHSALHILASTGAKDLSDINDTPTLRKIRKHFRDCGVDNNAAAALCYMVLNGAAIDLKNVECRTPLYYIRNAELKKTLKKIALGKIPDDMSSWEDLGEDEDLKKGHLRSNSSVDDIIVKGNNDMSITDKGSPNRIRQDSAESESGADFPAGNQKKTGKPKIEVFDLVHKIEVSDLDMGPVVGKGQFGVVHRASWRGTPVAVKKISMMGSKKEEIEKEVAIHRRACHPNIVQMMALGYQGREAFLVMQFIEGPSLYTIIFPDRDDVKIPLRWAKKLQISREVLQAVTFMHACNILHLDIKPANILVDTLTMRPYICDLGLAHIKNLMSQSTVNMKGTPCFMPPEALGATEPGYRHSNKHDIWSVAGTLVELYSMKRLWGDSMNPLALMARIMTGQMGNPESLTAVDPKVQKILEPCFKQKPEKRPSASDLLHQFNDLTL